MKTTAQARKNAMEHCEGALDAAGFDLRAQWLIDLLTDFAELEQDRNRLAGLINTPETEDFSRAVELEAAHQIERFGGDDRRKKSDIDWLWLVAYLSGKALFGKQYARKYADWRRSFAISLVGLAPDARAIEGDEKYRHRIITVAAACRNWFRHRWPGKGVEGVEGAQSHVQESQGKGSPP